LEPNLSLVNYGTKNSLGEPAAYQSFELSWSSVTSRWFLKLYNKFDLSIPVRIWSSINSTSIQDNAWSRIATSYYPRDGRKETLPAFYVGGSAISLSQTADKDANSLESEIGIPLIIGGYKFSDLITRESYGSFIIKNVLIYNRILTAAEIAADAAGTLVTDGLVFRGLAIPTNQANAYYDAALTTSQPLHDDINGALGIPYGAPTCREII
jgi:hypothetical protein